MLNRRSQLHYNTTEELLDDGAFTGLHEVIQYATEKMKEMKHDISWLKKAIMPPVNKKPGYGEDEWEYFNKGWYSSTADSFGWLCSSSEYFFVTRADENANSLLLSAPAEYKNITNSKVRQIQNVAMHNAKYTMHNAQI